MELIEFILAVKLICNNSPDPEQCVYRHKDCVRRGRVIANRVNSGLEVYALKHKRIYKICLNK